MSKAKKRTALVTGASSGIGKSIATRLAADGFEVILVSRTASSLEKVLEEIKAAGGTGRVMVCDVSNQKAVNAMMEQVESLDVLVNNAGRSGGGHTVQMDDQLWHDIIATNLNSVYYLTKAALAQNKINKPGSIISIASTGGKQGIIYGAAYSASKHGIVGYSKSLGLELAKDNTPSMPFAQVLSKLLWRVVPDKCIVRSGILHLKMPRRVSNKEFQ